jgi:hypothetical protein
VIEHKAKSEARAWLNAETFQKAKAEAEAGRRQKQRQVLTLLGGLNDIRSAYT